MRKNIHKNILIITAIGIMSTAALAAQQNERPCRAEIKKLCGNDRENLRQCVKDNYENMSENCKMAIKDRAQSQGQENPRRAKKSDDSKFMGGAKTFSYGDNRKMAVDFYPPKNIRAATLPRAQKPALILYIHGGGWRNGDKKMVGNKAEYFTQNGYAFGSIGYRLLPDAPVETQIDDVAAAIAMMRSKAAELGFDGDNIILMGHSAGAHLAAYMGTDERATGTNFRAIKGIILLDGAGYDVEKNMASEPFVTKKIYEDAFGTDPVRQRALSPATYTNGLNASNWLILHVSNRDASSQQSTILQNLLVKNGANVVRQSVDMTHATINRDFGNDDYPAAAQVREFLKGF
ncbi:hypothetical protein LPB140_11355 [Sphingorhabdus lutea]|uniref:BD-FAE-like domain-containing protein n=1 Tax=Sphingorhabdus lutea TaxID=1913578 RepID=A0A1L3JDR1_9SPHN|nr:alpha/beta hydrolase [Sphingorhabdus lutea]APG63281.1 hypothetical protein LPB140_11355 [Sphingorhabdus lutea]